jgi:hypothetical protein
MVNAVPTPPAGRVATPPNNSPQQAATTSLNALKTVSNIQGRVYIEDILTKYNQDPNSLPISFVQHYLDANTDAGVGLPPQYHQGRSLVGALVNQVYDTSISGFQRIQLSIRGDPYWLGQSNAERQIALDAGKTYDKYNLPDWSSGNPLLFFYWRYPLQTGDDYKPLLTDSGFNGIYECNEVTHTFADGAFKQVLTCTRAPLIDIDLAYAVDQTSESVQISSRSVVPLA